MQSHLRQFMSWYLSGFISVCVIGISMHFSCVVLFKSLQVTCTAVMRLEVPYKGSRHYCFFKSSFSPY
jgi:hypothetical protein